MKTEPKQSVYDIDEGGLTKREYFAAMAMQGFIASINQSKEQSIDAICEIPNNTASWAVKFADSLITELNKEVAP